MNLTRMRILGNGRVGIGTTSPSTELEVDGSVNIVGNILHNGVNISDRIDDLSTNTSVSLNGKHAVISSTARLNASLVGDGNVDNTEFGYLNGLTDTISNLLGAKLNTSAISTSIAENGLNPVNSDTIYHALEGKQDTINSDSYLNANLIGTGVVSNTEFNYLNGRTVCRIASARIFGRT